MNFKHSKITPSGYYYSYYGASIKDKKNTKCLVQAFLRVWVNLRIIS